MGGICYRAENWKLSCVFRSERRWLGFSLRPFDLTKAVAITDGLRGKSLSREECVVGHKSCLSVLRISVCAEM